MVQRVKTSDNEWYSEWQRVVQWMTASDNDWQRVVQQMATNESKKKRMRVILGFRTKQLCNVITTTYSATSFWKYSEAVEAANIDVL